MVAVVISSVGAFGGVSSGERARLSGAATVVGAAVGCVIVAVPSVVASPCLFSDRVARNFNRDLMPEIKAFTSQMSFV